MADLKPGEGDVVVAIDFGTTRTAVAYTVVGGTSCFIDVLPPGKAGSLVQGDRKTPSSLLIGNNYVIFGCDAEQRFAERGDDHEDWKLFQYFKMELHKPLEADPRVESLGNRGSLPVSEILEASLKYLTGKAIEHLKCTSVLMSGNPHDVFWVLTLPAIWSPHAKAMMRKAAFKAGMIPTENSSRLMLALEPECAAISSEMWGKGTKFLIADCGGGTLDITVHEVIQSAPLQLRELQAPCGGPLGAAKVDEKFLDFFLSFIGREKFNRLKREYTVEYFELIRAWEQKKLQFGFDPQDDDWTILNLASVFGAMNLSTTELTSMADLWNTNNSTGQGFPIKQNKKKIYLPYWLMKSFFQSTVFAILEEVAAATELCPGLHYVVLNGGFGRCRLLREELEKHFAESGIHVVACKDPDLSIVKGAAMFGSTGGGYVISRKLRYTFGVECSPQYDAGEVKHIMNRKEIFLDRDGKERLDIFSVHGHVGEDLSCDSQVRRSYSPVTEKQKSVTFKVLVTKHRDVFLSKEEGVQCLCRAQIALGEMLQLPLRERRVWVQFHFGGPEVRCYFYDATGSKELNNVKVDFEFFSG